MSEFIKTENIYLSMKILANPLDLDQSLSIRDGLSINKKPCVSKPILKAIQKYRNLHKESNFIYN